MEAPASNSDKVARGARFLDATHAAARRASMKTSVPSPDAGVHVGAIAANAAISPAESPHSSASSTSGLAVAPLLCEECEELSATLECEDCGLVYCVACDRRRHRKGKLVFHQRQRMPRLDPLELALADRDAHTTPNAAAAAVWTVAQVVSWLRDHELDVFLPEVNAHGIDGAFLVSDKMTQFLDAQSSAARGHKKKLLREIHKLKASDSDAASTPYSDSASATKATLVAAPPASVLTATATATATATTTERSSLRRMGVNLRVNVDAQPASAPEKHFSPVTALRARANHGQVDDTKGRVARRKTLYADLVLDERAATPVVNLNTSEERRSNSSSSYKSQFHPPPPLQIVGNGRREPDEELHQQSQQQTGARDLRSIRQALGGLDLDLVKVKKGERAVEASFDFSAEGRLQTQGFEINTDGIANAPFPSEYTGQRSTQGTREHLLVLHELGHGASGKVYKALYLPTFKLVAIKVIRVFDQKKRHQMVRELKSLYVNYLPITDATKRAACDELVIFYDAYTNPEIGSVSIVLEYMDGGSLEDYMQSGRYRTEPELANLAACALKGLAFLHEHHQLHRDIKLSNMLINHQGQVKISDFGISRDLESTLAKATTFTGTLLYMAPERISGGTYSYPSDIWSFGLALMACAIGKLPVPTKEGYWGVVHAVQEQPSPSLRDHGDHFSPELCEFLDQCLQKNPLARPTAAQLLAHPFIQQNYQPPDQLASPDKSHERPDKDEKKLRELDEIASHVRTWCQGHADALLSPAKDGSGSVFHQVSVDSKVRALAAQLRVPVNVVAERFAFLAQYAPPPAH